MEGIKSLSEAYCSHYHSLITPVIGASNSNPTSDIASKIEPLIGTYVSRDVICTIGEYTNSTIDKRVKGHQITKRRISGKIEYLLTDETATVLFNRNGKRSNGKTVRETNLEYWWNALLDYCAKEKKSLQELSEKEYMLLHFPVVYFASHNFAKKVSLDYRRTLIDDFILEGMEGLLNARKELTNGKGYTATQWRAYITIRIRGHIIDYLRNNLYKPRSLIKRENEVIKVEKHFDETGEDPTDSKVAKKLGISVNSLRMSRFKSAYAQPPVSIDDPNSGFRADNGELMLSETAPSPLDIAIENEQESHLWKIVDTLNPRHRGVLRFYYKHSLTLDQISNFIGIGGTPVDESRVCQIRKDALSKLKEKLKTDDAYSDY